MNIHPEILEALAEKKEDVEALINDILFVWIKDGFILRSEVDAMFVLTRLYRKNVQVGSNVFDELTKEFKGVVIHGSVESQAVFIPDQKLHDKISENQVLLVMKSPRTQGISVKDTQEIHVTKHEPN